MPITPALATIIENESGQHSFAFFSDDASSLWSKKKASRSEVIKALKANPPKKILIANPDFSEDAKILDVASKVSSVVKHIVYYPEGTIFDAGYKEDETPFNHRHIANFAFGKHSDFIETTVSLKLISAVGHLAIVFAHANDSMYEILVEFSKAVDSDEALRKELENDDLDRAETQKKIIKAFSAKPEYAALTQKLIESSKNYSELKKIHSDLLKVNERYAKFLRGEYHIKNEDIFNRRLFQSFEKAKTQLKLTDEDIFTICENLTNFY